MDLGFVAERALEPGVGLLGASIPRERRCPFEAAPLESRAQGFVLQDTQHPGRQCVRIPVRNQETGFAVASEAMQVMGALGYTEESLVEYCLRRTRGWMIAGGSVEILRNRIAEGVFGRTFSQRPS